MQALAITIASESAGLANFPSRLIPAQGLDEFQGDQQRRLALSRPRRLEAASESHIAEPRGAP